MMKKFCSAMRMCDVSYIDIFMSVSFMQAMATKNVILELIFMRTILGEN